MEGGQVRVGQRLPHRDAPPGIELQHLAHEVDRFRVHAGELPGKVFALYGMPEWAESACMMDPPMSAADVGVAARMAEAHNHCQYSIVSTGHDASFWPAAGISLGRQLLPFHLASHAEAMQAAG